MANLGSLRKGNIRAMYKRRISQIGSFQADFTVSGGNKILYSVCIFHSRTTGYVSDEYVLRLRERNGMCTGKMH